MRILPDTKPKVIVAHHRKPKKGVYNKAYGEYRKPKKEASPSMDWLINQLLDGKQR